MNWAHLKTILWLRSRISHNQWRRGGRFAAVLRVVFLVAGALLSISGAFGGLLLGSLALPRAPLWATWASLAAMSGLFLFVWLIGIVADIQRSEAIDIQRLLHLPISLGQVFSLNFLASLIAPAFLLFLPGFLGLAAGLTLSGGLEMLWLFPLIISALFLITTWTYWLRGWLVSLMVNKRRHRAIVMGLTGGIVLFCQIPNLAFNNNYTRDYLKQRHRISQQERQLSRRQRESNSKPTTTPKVSETRSPAIAYRQAMTLPAPWWTLCGISLANLVIGIGGLNRAYRMTLRFYQGQEAPSRTKAPPDSKPRRERTLLVERSLPGCSTPVSALTFAFLRSTLRAPETKMAMIMPVVMVLLFGSLNLERGTMAIPPAFLPLIVVGLSAAALISTIQLSANAFGADRNGFRALTLSPTPRRSILLAKNLSLLPFAGTIAVIFLVIGVFLFHLPAAIVFAGAMQFLTGYLLLSMVGNYTSTRAPFRVAAGSLKPTKNSPTKALLLLVLYLLYPLAMLPMLLPLVFAWLLAIWTPLTVATGTLLSASLFLVVVLVIYKLALIPAGRYLQEREREILLVVTTPVE